MNQSRPYLLAFRLDGRTVVVVGGGNIGTAKVETLLGTGARIRVVDPTPSARVVELAGQDLVELRQRCFARRDLVGTSLVIAATGERKTTRRVRRWARAMRVLVNAVDDPSLCDVTVPAVVRRGPATIGITTGGTAPAAARFLRETLTDAVEAALPERTGELLDLTGSLRTELRTSGRYRYDYRTWRAELLEPGLEAVHRGQSLSALADGFVSRFADAPEPPVGRVTLVGAGPGGADLVTVRGADALRSADAVIYDRLADPELLQLAPAAAVRIPVGKSKGAGTSQDDINELLVRHALRGDHVVRLKGGDPFVFGRGSEEVDALERHGIVVEVVPGLSSVTAAPVLAGIPLTDRRDAAAMLVTTGHRAGRHRVFDDAIAGAATTIVVLMAATTADHVAAELLERGLAPTTPVAFVHAAGTRHQKVAGADLAQTQHDGCPFPSPSVMVIGPTARRVAGSADAASAAAPSMI